MVIRTRLPPSMKAHTCIHFTYKSFFFSARRYLPYTICGPQADTEISFEMIKFRLSDAPVRII